MLRPSKTRPQPCGDIFLPPACFVALWHLIDNVSNTRLVATTVLFFQFHCTCDRIKHSSYDANAFQERTTLHGRTFFHSSPRTSDAPVSVLAFLRLIFVPFRIHTFSLSIQHLCLYLCFPISRLTTETGRSSNHGSSTFNPGREQGDGKIISGNPRLCS